MHVSGRREAARGGESDLSLGLLGESFVSFRTLRRSSRVRWRMGFNRFAQTFASRACVFVHRRAGFNILDFGFTIFDGMLMGFN